MSTFRPVPENVGSRGCIIPSRMANALESTPIVAFLATSNSSPSKSFYRDVLGLKLISEDQFALVFDAAGTMLRISIVQKAVITPYTVLGWQVSDVLATTKELQSRGVRFERYPGMKQDELGVWQSPSGAKIAWFKDPDGHTLSVTQF
jgi:catechol 2,3-dioxygenase-like lactoylglutathione lyase family enzyme